VIKEEGVDKGGPPSTVPVSEKGLAFLPRRKVPGLLGLGKGPSGGMQRAGE